MKSFSAKEDIEAKSAPDFRQVSRASIHLDEVWDTL